MGLTPREEFCIKQLLVEGKSLEELRVMLSGQIGKMITEERVRQIIGKAARKAFRYSRFFDESS